MENIHIISEYLILSNFKNDITSLSHWALEGDVVDFHCKRRWCLAIKEVKAKTSNCL